MRVSHRDQGPSLFIADGRGAMSPSLLTSVRRKMPFLLILATSRTAGDMPLALEFFDSTPFPSGMVRFAGTPGSPGLVVASVFLIERTNPLHACDSI